MPRLDEASGLAVAPPQHPKQSGPHKPELGEFAGNSWPQTE